jgi:mono/diheme cytochrome c family protein
MSNGSGKPSLVAPLGGVVVGVAVFLGVNITTGRAIIPTAESVTNPSYGLSAVVRPESERSAAPAAPTGPYQTVCATCHQQDGKGLPGAFPPLAGSQWLLGNPEIPARIVVLGLTGPIEVAGKKFASTMPPPPGLTDDQLAEAISFARSHFGNHAAAVDVSMIKKVRAELGGRTNSWTAPELQALQTAGGDGAAPAGDGEPAKEPAPAAAPTPAAKPAAAPTRAAPAPAKPRAAAVPAPAAAPTAAPEPAPTPAAQ